MITSSSKAAPVSKMTAASAVEVARNPQTRQPYISDSPIQMKWKGTVAHSENARIPATLTNTKRHQRISIQYRRANAAARRVAITRLVKVHPITRPAYGDDGVRNKLCAQPPHVHVDDVGSGREAVAPHGRQEALLGDCVASVSHELGQQHRFPASQRNRSRSGIRLLPDRVQHQPARRERARNEIEHTRLVIDCEDSVAGHSHLLPPTAEFAGLTKSSSRPPRGQR